MSKEFKQDRDKKQNGDTAAYPVSTYHKLGCVEVLNNQYEGLTKFEKLSTDFAAAYINAKTNVNYRPDAKQVAKVSNEYAKALLDSWEELK